MKTFWLVMSAVCSFLIGALMMLGLASLGTSPFVGLPLTFALIMFSYSAEKRYRK